MNFAAFFSAATGIANGPFDYQRRLACGERQPGEPDDDWLSRGTKCESKLINIPTGLGKTAAVVLAWLWNRLRPPLNNQPSSINSPEWPRRLVYCLPMRTLVEQTQKEVRKWLVRLARKYTKPQDGSDLRWLALHSPNILMGGAETDRDWDVRPEKPAILIGTQDMLLSRALNRGYGMSRYRWPMHFGLLHTDCLWVFDEIQLMGCGLATTAQLEAFRNRLGQSDCASFWMSATLQKDWLKTVDYADPSALPLVKLEEDDLQNSDARERREARKPIQPATARMEDSAGVAAGFLMHTNALAVAPWLS